MKLKHTIAALAATALAANAAVIANYDADPDNDLGTAAPSPGTQGWTLISSGLQASSGDNTGWQINDTSATDVPGFRVTNTAPNFQDMHDNGWTMSATIRLSDTANFFGWGISAASAGNAGLTGWGFTGRERVALNFVESGADTVIGDLSSGDSFTVVGGLNTYIDLLVVGEAGNENYEVFIDGVSKWSSTIGAGGSNSASDDFFIVSSGSTGGVGRTVDYAAVNLTTIPEPSTAALLGLAGLALTLRRRK